MARVVIDSRGPGRGQAIDPAKASALIKRQGRKISWLAKECCMSTTQMSRILLGKRTATAATVKLLSLAFSVSPEEFLKREAEAS